MENFLESEAALEPNALLKFLSDARRRIASFNDSPDRI